ncbi:MAG: hypothetical protein EOP83_08415 [Verrucomicrobiaceae bacterium]|nr:MAG: hypothetical protein EOP83_08415 [Verrucomicrobiaceae bacterium]
MRTFQAEQPGIIAPCFREAGFSHAFCCCVDDHSAVIEALNWCVDEFEAGEFELHNQWRIFVRSELHAFQFKMRFC